MELDEVNTLAIELLLDFDETDMCDRYVVYIANTVLDNIYIIDLEEHQKLIDELIYAGFADEIITETDLYDALYSYVYEFIYRIL